MSTCTDLATACEKCRPRLLMQAQSARSAGGVILRPPIPEAKAITRSGILVTEAPRRPSRSERRARLKKMPRAEKMMVKRERAKLRGG